jgi:hypothetical protein
MFLKTQRGCHNKMTASYDMKDGSVSLNMISIFYYVMYDAGVAALCL